LAETHVFGEVKFNRRFLELLASNRVILHVYNCFRYYMNSYYPRRHYNSGFVTLRQAQHHLDSEKKADLAGGGSVENMLKNLRYYENRVGGLSDN